LLTPEFTHLVNAVDHLRLIGILVYHFDCGDVGAIVGVLFELHLILNEEVHETFFFFNGEVRENKSLGLLVIVVSDRRNTPSVMRLVTLRHVLWEFLLESLEGRIMLES
jgi:hypothetical protein